MINDHAPFAMMKPAKIQKVLDAAVDLLIYDCDLVLPKAPYESVMLAFDLSRTVNKYFYTDDDTRAGDFDLFVFHTGSGLASPFTLPRLRIRVGDWLQHGSIARSTRAMCDVAELLRDGHRSSTLTEHVLDLVDERDELHLKVPPQ